MYLRLLWSSLCRLASRVLGLQACFTTPSMLGEGWIEEEQMREQLRAQWVRGLAVQEWEPKFSTSLHVKNWELPCYVQAMTCNFRTVWGKEGGS